METLLKIAHGSGLELWELLNFESDLPALSEDAAKDGRSAPRKRARKPAGG